MAVNTTVQVTLPAMGESVREGTVLEWHKQEGDAVEADEPLVDVSTDKVDAEVPAPAAGTLVRILAAEGDTVAVGGVLAEIAPNGGGAVAADEDRSDGAASAAGQGNGTSAMSPAPSESPSAPAPNAMSARRSTASSTGPRRPIGSRAGSSRLVSTVTATTFRSSDAAATAALIMSDPPEA
ncbi:MAG: hypothetical protein KY463_16135 [Actinobacteria bacterium]|nr:hypothetical protein [Actinomycetota bacterium]